MLESYIAPLFMSYVDKYIRNLKPEDLSLSIWGGDVMLNNLELNLSVLQQELNLPVTFLSGKIYKLQLHVPWTRLIYEPVVVTIDTMEFVIKLRDGTAASMASETSKDDKQNTAGPTPPSSNVEQMPPGYVQGILNKVINNIAFKVNNIIVKYVEDDLVFSVNVKSVDFHSANANWEKDFIELTLPELLLQKICEVTDLTICLDQRNPSGKIDVYRDPLLYRCNLQCRIASKYKGLSSSKPYESKIDVYCEKIDLSITDQQIPMLSRLLKLILGLYYGTLDLPGCLDNLHTAPQIIERNKNKRKTPSNAAPAEDATQSADDSWTSWALSMVPGMAETPQDTSLSHTNHVETTFGLYVANLTLTIKKTNSLFDTVITSRLEFLPMFCFELDSCKVNITTSDETLFDVELSIKSIAGFILGKKCVCNDKQPVEEEKEDEERFLVVGDVDENIENALTFLKGGLFETLLQKPSIAAEEFAPAETSSNGNSPVTETSDDNSLKMEVSTSDEHSKEQEKEKESDPPALYFSYFWEMFLPDYPESGEIENIFLYPEVDETVREVSAKQLKTSNSKVFMTSKVMHTFSWLSEVMAVPTPPRKEKEGLFLDPFVLQQLELGNFLFRKFDISFSNSSLFLSACNHIKGCAKNYNQSNEVLAFNVDQCSILKTDPMYPKEISSYIESGKLVKLSKPPKVHSDTQLEVKGLACQLQRQFEDGCSEAIIPNCTILNPLSLTLNMQAYLSNVDVISKMSVNLPEASVQFTKNQLLVSISIFTSWLYSSKLVYLNSVQGMPIVCVLKNLSLSYVNCQSLYGVSGSLGSVSTSLMDTDAVKTSSMIFQAPCHTLSTSDYKSWLEPTDSLSDSDFITFLVQCKKKGVDSGEIPTQVFSLDINGCCLNLNKALFTWLQKCEDSPKPNQVHRLVSRQSSTALNKSTTIPKHNKSYARIIGASSASSQKSKEKENQSELKSPASSSHPVIGERFGDTISNWLNFLKSFNINMKIESLVLLLPESDLPLADFDIIKAYRTAYAQKNDFPSTLMLSCPLLEVISSTTAKDIFTYPLPIESNNKQENTLPWTVTSSNMSAIILSHNNTYDTENGKIEQNYLCKPVSWNLYVASTVKASETAAKVAELGVIKESKQHAVREEDKMLTLFKSPVVPKMHSNIGFVLHMDWSTCDMYISQEQVKFLLEMANSLLDVANVMDFSKIAPSATPRQQKEDEISATQPVGVFSKSVSSSSDLDHAEAFSTLTGSTFLPKAKAPEEISVSLWMQSTLPKIKLTLISNANDANTFYQVSTEINELMFSFDYQNNVLKLTNKIAAFATYYYLLRFDHTPIKGWTLLDQGNLICQRDDNQSYVEAKTFLSLTYQRTYHQLNNPLSPVRSLGQRDTGVSSIFSSATVKNDCVMKHELTVHILPFDVICVAKPLLSSLTILTGILSSSFVSRITSSKEVTIAQPSEKATALVTMPVINVHLDNIRVIVPVGKAKFTEYMCTNTSESVFVLHVQSMSLTSSPCNPITKSVVDKDAYKTFKHAYREPLKRLKLWNIQYQLDVKNMGLCTTNWPNIESSLGGAHRDNNRPEVSGQNPAFEWNCHSEFTERVLSPICTGFDLKLTLAPPLLACSSNQMSHLTSTGVDLHSPREIHLYLNTSQMELMLKVVNEFNSFLVDLSRVLLRRPANSQSLVENEKDVAESGISEEIKTPVQSSNVPPLELFASVCGVTLTLYRKTNQPITVYPSMYTSLSQVNCSISTIHDNKLQLNLHALKILTSSNSDGFTQKAAPTSSDFDIELFVCGQGNINKKLGLLPELANFQLSMNEQQKLDANIKIQKPVSLNLCMDFAHNLLSLYQDISKIVDEQMSKAKPAMAENKTTPEEPVSLLPEVNCVKFETKKVQVTYAASSECAKLDCLYQSLSGDVYFRMKNGTIKCAEVTANLGGSEIYLTKDNCSRQLLRPFFCTLRCTANFIPHSGNESNQSFLPQLNFWLKSGAIQLSFNQQLLAALTDLTSKSSNAVNEEQVQPQTESIVCFDITESEDDLRNGFSKYVFLKDGERMYTPKENEILFTCESAKDPMMVWRYEQPRVFTEITVLPVPFQLSSSVKCTLEYWDEMAKVFCSCHTLYLSETESSHYHICDREQLRSGKAMSSALWRITVHDEDNSVKIPASSLAVCMKLNSVFSSLIVPSVQVNLDVEALQLTLENSSAFLGKNSPNDFEPFYIEPHAYPATVEIFSVTLSDITTAVRFVTGISLDLHSSCIADVQTMDFNDLCWIPFVKPAQMSLQYDQIKDTCADIKLEAGTFELRVTPSIVHTLSMLARAWNGDAQTRSLVYSHYLVCNNTDDVIHMKQSGTEEELAINSGQCLPYSWLAADDRQLVFSLIPTAGVYCEAVDIEQCGVFPRDIDHGTHVSRLIIEVVQRTGVVKQVIIHGSCSFVNKTDLDLHVTVNCQHSQTNVSLQSKVENVSKDLILPSNVVRPSMTTSVLFIKSLCVVQNASFTNHDVEFPNDLKEHCFLIQLNKSSSVWLTFTHDERLPSHITITVTPLFIIRNHMPTPVLFRCSNGDFNVEFEIDGKGKERQIAELNHDKAYGLQVKLSDSEVFSEPPISLNSVVAEKLKAKECYADHMLTNAAWPYMRLCAKSKQMATLTQRISYSSDVTSPSSTNPPTKHSEEFADKNIIEVTEMFVQSSLCWSHLPTVLLDLKPCLLLRNSARKAIVVECDGGVTYVIDAQETISLHQSRKRLKIGTKQISKATDEFHETSPHFVWSTPVSVLRSGDEPPTSTATTASGNLLPGGHAHCTVIDEQNSTCEQFTLACNERDSMFLVDVKERFCVHNLSKHPLLASLYMGHKPKDQKTDDVGEVLITCEQSIACSLLTNYGETLSIPASMFVDFRLQPEENSKEVTNFSTFCLSKEHLKESLLLTRSSSRESTTFCVTSSLEEGVINVFIDEDVSTAVLIRNNCSVDFYMNEISLADLNKRSYEVLCKDLNKLINLHNNERGVHFQPRSFIDAFPRSDTKIEFACQLGLKKNTVVELSEPILLEDGLNTRVYIPEHREVFVQTKLVYSQLYVELNDTKQEAVVLIKSLALPKINISFDRICAVIADNVDGKTTQNLMSVNLCNLRLSHEVEQDSSLFKMQTDSIQLDNQLTEYCYHFPVVFLPMRQLQERYHAVAEDAPFRGVEACSDADFLALAVRVCSSEIDGSNFVDSIQVNMQPCETYVEDTFVYRLAASFDQFVPPTTAEQSQDDPKDVALPILHPVRMCRLEIGELSMLLSIHASVKVFLSSHHMPVVLGRFACAPTQTVNKEFLRSVLYHYATQALVRAGWMLGSLEIIGNPTGLLNNLGRGISNFFTLPYRSMRNGPGAFVNGVSRGTSSFLTHFSTGALTSVNNFASSVSRNMDYLCLDQRHLAMQEERRVQATRRVSGLSTAFGGLGLSILGAVAGIVDQPMQNLTSANTTAEAVSGVMTGLAKGMVGAVTKPIGGAMEFISQASQQIMQGAGLAKAPEKVINSEQEVTTRCYSKMKFFWQILHLESYRNALLLCEEVYLRDNKTLLSCSLILTESVLFIYDNQSACVKQAFSLPYVTMEEVECADDTTQDDLNHIAEKSNTFTGKMSHSQYANDTSQEDSNTANHTEKLKLNHTSTSKMSHLRISKAEKRLSQSSFYEGEEHPNFRRFFDSFESASASNQQEALTATSSLVLDVFVRPVDAVIFVSAFQANRNAIKENTCLNSGGGVQL